MGLSLCQPRSNTHFPSKSTGQICHMIPPNFKETKGFNVPRCLECRSGCERALKSHCHRQARGYADKHEAEDLSPGFQGITVSYTDF